MKEFLKSDTTVGNINPDVSICVHKYEDAKKSNKMGDKLKNYLDRWDKIGFLQGFPDDRKEELAFAYEQLAIFLIYCESDQTDKLFDKDEYGNLPFETIGFPMVRRVLGNLESNVFDFQKFLNYCKIFNVNDIIKLLTYNELCYQRIDYEAEGVAICCEMIEKKFKNPNKNDEEIKNESLDRLYKIIEDKKKKNERASSDNTNE
jgi:hypothetical protein